MDCLIIHDSFMIICIRSVLELCGGELKALSDIELRKRTDLNLS